MFATVSNPLPEDTLELKIAAVRATTAEHIHSVRALPSKLEACITTFNRVLSLDHDTLAEGNLRQHTQELLRIAQGHLQPDNNPNPAPHHNSNNTQRAITVFAGLLAGWGFWAWVNSSDSNTTEKEDYSSAYQYDKARTHTSMSSTAKTVATLGVTGATGTTTDLLLSSYFESRRRAKEKILRADVDRLIQLWEPAPTSTSTSVQAP